MSELSTVVKTLKCKPHVLEVLTKYSKIDLQKYIEKFPKLELEEKRQLEDVLADYGLLNKEKIKEEREKSLVKDNVPQYYYNYEFKMNYLDNHTDYKEKTKRVCRVFFRKMSDIEYELGKDFYDFNGIEVERTLKHFKSTTVRSLQNITSLLSKYVEYAIVEKVSKLRSNPLENFSTQEKLSNLIDLEASQRMYFERRDVMSMAVNSENPQDGVILALIYDGVSPKNNFSELVNLKISDVDWDMSEVSIAGREVPLKLSSETLLLLKGAVDLDVYYSINGDSLRKYDIEKTDYVLRGLRNKGNVPMSWRNVNQRILRIAEINEEEYLNATNVSSSGQIDCAYELFINDKSLGDRAIVQALEKYNQSVNKSSIFALKKKVNVYKGTHIS